MKKLTVIAIAAVVAATGAASTVSAALSDRDGTIWHGSDDMQVAARDGQRGARDNGGRDRDVGRSKKGNAIFRIRNGKHRPFLLFRHDRGQDCSVQKTQVRDESGALIVRNARICD